jgi:hypothetical protein
MTGDDAASLTGILREYGALWKITRTPDGYTATRRPPPAPPTSTPPAPSSPAPPANRWHDRQRS